MPSKRPLVRSKQDITYGDGIAYQLVQLPSYALISLSQNVTLVPSPSIIAALINVKHTVLQGTSPLQISNSPI